MESPAPGVPGTGQWRVRGPGGAGGPAAVVPPLPPDVLSWLGERGVAPSALQIAHRRRGRPGRVVALGPDVVVRVALDDAARRWLAVEREGAAWAAAAGIATPAVLAADESVLVTERVAQDPHGGAGFVRSVVELAAAVEAAGPPPPRPPAPAAPRPTASARLARAARGVRRRVDWRDFAAARAAAERLPRDVTVHGDFHGANVLHDRAAGRTVLVDWEDAGRGPRGTDLLTLWPRLADGDDRGALLDAVLTASTDRRATAVLHHWHAVRYLADLCTAPVPADAELVARARARAVEARAHLRSAGG